MVINKISMHDELPPGKDSMVCGTHPSIQKPVGVALTACAVQMQTISQEDFHNVMRDFKVTKDAVRAE